MSRPAVRSAILSLPLFALLLGQGCGSPAETPRDAEGDSGPDARADRTPPADRTDDVTGDTGPDALPPAELGETQLKPECNPLGYGGNCMMPFPSTVYLKEESGSTTGLRLALPPEAMPKTPTTPDIDPTPFNHLDGYSPATPILVYLGGPAGEPLDGDALSGLNDLDRSLDPTGPTVLIELATGERVEHLAEIDASMSNDPIRTLLLRPLARLKPNTRYAVGITRKLTAGGTPVEATAGFAAIRDGRPSKVPTLEALRQPTLDAIDALVKSGTERDELVLAWDFTTSSEDQISGWMLEMRNTGLAALAAETGPRINVIDVVENPEGHPDALRHIRGTFKAPLFLADGGSGSAGLARDATGKPILGGLYDVPFTAVIPRIAATQPTRLFVAGHGLGGDAEGTVTDTRIERFANQYGFSVIATDWLGLSMGDLTVALQAAQDINKIAIVTDRLQQGLINSLALSRLARTELAALPAFQVGAGSALDGRVFYFGASLGGIMGTSLMAYTDDIERGVVGVAGGVWSTLVQRSAIWIPLEAIFRSIVPDAPQRQLLIAFLQMLFDPTDPVSVAPHVLRDPLPGIPAKQLFLPMSLGDPLVANIATYALARTMELPYLTPSVVDIYGLEGVAGPVDSAMVVYDTGEAPNTPTTNTATDEGSGAHSDLFFYEALQSQMSQFLEDDGRVVQTCDGPCDPM